MTEVNKVSDAVASTPAALALQIVAVLLYAAFVVLVVFTKQFGVGYSKCIFLCVKAVPQTLAAGMNIAIHIAFGGTLFFSLFNETWSSNAYWFSIGVSLASALWISMYVFLR